jgi:phospholipase/carboxylesterase
VSASPQLHRGQPVQSAGAPLAEAAGAMVMIHGRGATAESLLELAGEFYRPDWAYLAPQAAGYSWYPQRFLAPFEQNQPWLSSALAALGDLTERIGAAGIPAERTVLLGFSQGACLSLEFAARNAKRYGGVIALSGGLIGPDGAPRDYPGSLAGTPVFLGCSDSDPHIPEPRVHDAARVMERLGGAVTERIYPGLGHAVNEDEMEFVRQLLAV